jgi:hypothetical protein
VAGEDETPDPAAPDWRPKLEHLARQSWSRVQRHPWIIQVGVHRPPLGPNVLALVEAALQAVDGLGLDELEMDLLTSLIGDYVRGAVRAALEAREVEQTSGMSDEQWWALNEELLKGLVEPDRYPTTVRVGQAYKAAKEYGPDHLRSFEFGLQRVLDGIQVFIDRRRANLA